MIFEKLTTLTYALICIVAIGCLFYYLVRGRIPKEFRLLSILSICIALFCMSTRFFAMSQQMIGIGIFILLAVFLVALGRAVIKLKVVKEVVHNKIFIGSVMVIILGIIVVAIIELT